MTILILTRILEVLKQKGVKIYLSVFFLSFLVSPCILSDQAGAQVLLAGKKINIVLLGDSFSAGNGAGSYTGIDGCYRSQKNWASGLVRRLKEEGVSVSYQNRACSGATTKNCFILT